MYETLVTCVTKLISSRSALTAVNVSRRALKLTFSHHVDFTHDPELLHGCGCVISKDSLAGSLYLLCFAELMWRDAPASDLVSAVAEHHRGAFCIGGHGFWRQLARRHVQQGLLKHLGHHRRPILCRERLDHGRADSNEQRTHQLP